MSKHYYYLHANGDIIGKVAHIVDSDPHYFDSDFIKWMWHIDTEDRNDAWRVVLEGCALGAQTSRLKELSEKWNLTLEDSIEMMEHGVLNGALCFHGVERFATDILGITYDEFQNKINEATKNL